MASLLGRQIDDLDARIKELDVKLAAAHQANERIADQPAAGVPLPHPLLEGAGPLPPGRAAAGGQGRRQHRRLPLPDDGRRSARSRPDLPARLSAVDRFQSALRARGVEVEPRVLPDSARTAPEAAAAVGTEVGAIVKSLVFRCGDEAVLVLVSGANRADEARLEEEFGAPVSRADADFARAATGFSIGGVPPSGTRRRCARWSTRTCWLRGRVGRRRARRTRSSRSRRANWRSSPAAAWSGSPRPLAEPGERAVPVGADLLHPRIASSSGAGVSG